MEIISHRGFWKNVAEKNTALSFSRSFERGWGTETDVRHHRGKLVISHDIPTDESMLFEDFIALYESSDCEGTIALNIKEDGLQNLISPFLSRVQQHFLFDMSVPDQRLSQNLGLKCFSRYSDVENPPVYEKKAAGFWIDTFESEWLTTDILEALLNKNRPCCFVSPELHNKDCQQMWEMLLPFRESKNFIICTDKPDVATLFFGGK